MKLSKIILLCWCMVSFKSPDAVDMAAFPAPQPAEAAAQTPAREGGTPTYASTELPARLRQKMDEMIEKQLKEEAFPGASFLVGNREGILYEKTYGYHDYSNTQPVTPDDVYDVASLTKVLSTTFVLMRLYDDGLIRLDQTIGETLPELQDTPVGTVTVQELLTHTSGFRQHTFYQNLVSAREGQRLFSKTKTEDFPYHVDKNLYMARYIQFNNDYLSYEPVPGYRKVAENLYLNPSFDLVILNKMIDGYQPERRGKFRYVCTNFYFLKLMIEEITDMSLDVLSDELYYELDALNTGYRPLEWTTLDKIVPTEDDYLLRRGQVHGVVHDELSALSEGVGGNSGLFTNTRDISRFCQMIVNNGSLDGIQIIKPSTVAKFTSSLLAEDKIYRGLGFDKRSDTHELGGVSCSGHTGFTGTMFWLDRDSGYYMVFLSNSVNPTRTNKKLSASMLRAKLWQEVAAYAKAAARNR